MSEVACQSRRHLAARILVIILSYFLNASCKCIQNSHMYFWMESYIMMWHLLAYQLKLEKTLVADCRSDFTEARGWKERIPLRRHIGQANIAYHPNFVLIHLEGMNLDCPSGWYSNESLALETGGSFGPFFPPSTTFRENWITDIQETSREKTSLSLDSTSLKECVSGMPWGDVVYQHCWCPERSVRAIHPMAAPYRSVFHLGNAPWVFSPAVYFLDILGVYCYETI